VAHTQTDSGRINPSSFPFRNKAARYGAKQTNSSSFSSNHSDGGKRQRVTLDTSALFLIWNAAAAIAPSHSKKEEEEVPKGSRAAVAAAPGTGRETEREGSGRVAKVSGESSQSRAAGRTSGHRLAGQLHSNGSSHLRSKRQTTGAGQNPRSSRCGGQQWRRGNADGGADGADVAQDAGRRSHRGCGAHHDNAHVGADGADFAPSNAHSIQSIRGSTREAAMDIWRIILAIAQVAAAQNEIVVFDELDSAPMARFHSIGQVFPDALYGHIVVTFDVALLRQEIKELQEGISYRQNRAPPEHRGLYDMLEENLVAGNQELEDDMDFFTTSERKERIFGEWIAGILGLWNVVQIHEVKKMVEGTKKDLMLEVHHVDALRDYAEATRDNLGRLAKRISQQTNFLWSKMEQISSKAAVNDALKPITAISEIATTITAHRLDRAVMDLVNVPNVFSEYAERLEKEGWYIELDGWQDIFHLEASYHASAATLMVAVRIPLLRRESPGYNLYKPTFFPIMHGSQLYDIRTDERIFAWEKATASYLNLDEEALNRCIQAGNKYYCSEDKVVMQKSPQTCLSAVWLQAWGQY
jgi:hypothetical protein